MSLDGVLEGGQSSVSVSFTEDLDDGHWVLPVSQVRINIVLQAECVPMGPIVIHGFGPLVGNT
jgi:hypothetical protein